MEEAEIEGTQEPAPAQQTDQEHQQETTQETKPEGWDQVEFTQEQQQRFNKVYKDLKVYQRETFELRDIARQQSELLARLQQDQSKIVNHLQESDFSKAEGLLKAQRTQAYEKGDLQAVDDINDKLLELKLHKNNSAKEKEARQPQYIPPNGQDIVNLAIQRGAIQPQDGELYRAWANEVDDYGNPKRPWVNSYDPRNVAAVSEGRAVFNNPTFANKTMAEKLQEIDRRMGIQNRQASSNVLPGGNLTRASKINTVKLDPKAEQLAVKMKIAGPNKTPQEHIQAWKEQIIALGGKR